MTTSLQRLISIPDGSRHDCYASITQLSTGAYARSLRPGSPLLLRRIPCSSTRRSSVYLQNYKASKSMLQCPLSEVVYYLAYGRFCAVVPGACSCGAVRFLPKWGKRCAGGICVIYGMAQRFAGPLRKRLHLAVPNSFLDELLCSGAYLHGVWGYDR